jgi:hypothetical protein
MSACLDLFRCHGNLVEALLGGARNRSPSARPVTARLGHGNELSRCRLLGCVRFVRNPSLRPWLCQRAGAVFVSGGEFVGAARGAILAQARSHTETNDLLV